MYRLFNKSSLNSFTDYKELENQSQIGWFHITIIPLSLKPNLDQPNRQSTSFVEDFKKIKNFEIILLIKSNFIHNFVQFMDC